VARSGATPNRELFAVDLGATLRRSCRMNFGSNCFATITHIRTRCHISVTTRDTSLVTNQNSAGHSAHGEHNLQFPIHGTLRACLTSHRQLKRVMRVKTIRRYSGPISPNAHGDQNVQRDQFQGRARTGDTLTQNGNRKSYCTRIGY